MDINSISLKLIQIFKKQIQQPLLKFVLLIALLMVTFSSVQLSADDKEKTNQDYVTFWSDYKNILLFRPNLVKTVFTQIIDLKGNTRTARRIINYEVLGCRTEVSFNAGCRIDQLMLLKKNRNIPNQYTIPANFIGFSLHPYKFSKSKFVIRLSWRPALFKPPLIAVDEFLDYVNAARNSKIYGLKPGLERIQLIPNFQKHIEIVVNKVMAKNLMKLYEKPHLDLKDSITFVLDSTHNTRHYDISSFTLDLNAVKVKVNHQIYRVQKDSVL